MTKQHNTKVSVQVFLIFIGLFPFILTAFPSGFLISLTFYVTFFIKYILIFTSISNISGSGMKRRQCWRYQHLWKCLYHPKNAAVAADCTTVSILAKRKRRTFISQFLLLLHCLLQRLSNETYTLILTGSYERLSYMKRMSS